MKGADWWYIGFLCGMLGEKLAAAITKAKGWRR